MERVTLGRMQNPIPGFLHGGAAIASLLALLGVNRDAIQIQPSGAEAAAARP